MNDDRRIYLLGLAVIASFLSGLRPVVCPGQSITPSKNWKNTIAFEADPFYWFGTVRWVKFVILVEPYDPNLVYYLHSKRYPFHYNGAVAEIDPFLGMTSEEFNAVSLFKEGQQVILGTMIVPPESAVTGEPEFAEFGIQFVRQDPFSREEIRDLFNLVRESVISESGVQPYYFPTFEQQATAEQNQDWYATEGIELSSTARWAKGNTCYAQGWAMGCVTFVTPLRLRGPTGRTNWDLPIFSSRTAYQPKSPSWRGSSPWLPRPLTDTWRYSQKHTTSPSSISCRPRTRKRPWHSKAIASSTVPSMTCMGAAMCG
ncbi:MAG: hypothetical protein IH892_12155 [Planctomycetes bacterium]|nr:hypothetical protein [Planctomycetota bacterium]